MMKKLTSFTIIELVVAMTISMIAVASTYTIYQIVYKRFYNYKQDNQLIKRVSQMNSIIQDDFEKAKLISCEEQTLNFTYYDGTGCKYTFEPDYMIREVSLYKDTFDFQINERVNYYNQDKCSTGIIDELSFKMQLYGHVLSFYYSKEYAADILMEHAENNKYK